MESSGRPRNSFIEERLYDDVEELEIEEEHTGNGRARKAVPMWDTFKAFPTTAKRGSMQENKCLDTFMKLTKAFLYLICLAVTLVGGVCAVCAVLFLTAQTRERSGPTYCNEDLELLGRFIITPTTSFQILQNTALLLLLVLPELLSLISSLCSSLFRRESKYPRKLTILLIFTFETLSALGISLLIFGGLRALDTLEAVGVLACVGSLPAVFNILAARPTRNNKVSILAKLLDALILLGQVSGVTYSIIIQNNTNTNWLLPVGLVLSTARYWGNYTSRHSRLRIIKYLSQHHSNFHLKKHLLKTHLSLYRAFLYTLLYFFITSHTFNVEYSTFFELLLKSKHEMLINLSGNETATYTFPLQTHSTFFETEISENTLILQVKTLFSFTVSSVAIGCGLVVYQIARFTFKTHMNIFGYAVPIILVGPSTILLLLVLFLSRENDPCTLRNFFPDIFFDPPTSSLNLPAYYTTYRIYLWTFWFFSHIWLTRHIFARNFAKLARNEEIFDCCNLDVIGLSSYFLSFNIKRKEKDENAIEEEKDPQVADLNEINVANPIPSIPIPISSSANERNGNNHMCTSRIYACATMWHEEKSEMKELIGSILRMDRDQCAIRVTQKYYGVRIRDYYELETHIFFDDAFKCLHNCVIDCPHPDTESQVNQYVIDLLETIETTIENLNMRYNKPVRYPTPFGGRMVWKLPGGSELVVHLKDKNRIRHRKRWSQVMYMYYLLGYQLMSSTGLSTSEKEELAENTYILTLDGDIDFQPQAVKTLVDLMKKNKELGAACGRIHPVGKGPMIWFQKFEYAVGHWLQKSTEHIIGSVLCSPGCFSLFRAKALMKNNVMAKYATKSSEPQHYIQYDQGEDRWLCTLILQSGSRVEYSAASDAYTHAPEKFRDFFIQRRRWIPSTVANILDLLNTARETRERNSDISWVYIGYQWVLMGSTVLGPGTIFLMMVGAAAAAFKISNWTSFTYNLLPILLFVLISVLFRERVQLIVAEIISMVYSLVMVVVFVGIMLQISEDGLLSPTTLLFFIIACQFVLTGLLHPREWKCLFCGLVFYVLVPSMYMVLIVYSIFNVHNVSWGTREKKSRALVRAEELQEQRENEELDRVEGTHKGRMQFTLAKLFSCSLFLHREKTESEKILEEIQESLRNIQERLQEMEHANELKEQLNSIKDTDEEVQAENLVLDEIEIEVETIGSLRSKIEAEIGQSEYLVSPCWLKDERLKVGDIDFLSNEEEGFWKNLIDKYLYPIDNEATKQKEIAQQLLTLRNEYLIKFFLLNAFFVLIVFLMQLNKDTLHLEWPLGIKYNITFDQTKNRVVMEKEYLKLEPIGCLFIAGFVSILLIQFLAMLVHRLDTFSHILANTEIGLPCRKKYETEMSLERHAEDIANGLQRIVEHEVTFDHRIYGGSSSTSTDYVDFEDRGGFETIFRRKLNEPSKGISRLLSKGLPRRTAEAFTRRRKELVNRKKHEGYQYDNAAFHI